MLSNWWCTIAILIVIDEPLEVAHEGHDVVRPLWWRVDHATGTVLQCGAGEPAEARVGVLERGLNGDHVVGREQSGLVRQTLSSAQGPHVVANLFGRWGGGLLGCTRLKRGGAAEQLVVGGDDVLDGRAILGLLKDQGIDENGLIRNRRREAFEFSQFSSRGRRLLENRCAFENRRIETGQRLER
jgi:hypothetical protein